MILRGINCQRYILDDKPFGKGGEGDIFALHNSADKCAKIYHTDRITKELEAKLKIMLYHPPSSNILSQVAWPLDLLYNSSNSFFGFIMPRLNISEDLSELYKYPPKEYKNVTMQQKLIVAQNICAVIWEVHNAGYVFGDFNPRNIGINLTTGNVAFLDTDSYHIYDKDTGITYRCKVCLDGYVAPELLKTCEPYRTEAFSKAPLPTFTRETDNFALAIHVFRLLMNGYTPFNGIKETESISTASPGQGNQAIKRDSYCFKPGNKPMASAVPPLEALPEEIAKLFSRAFIHGKADPKARPTAIEWHKALRKYENCLKTCTKNHIHQYKNTLIACPWCEADQRYATTITAPLSQRTFSTPIVASVIPPSVPPQSVISSVPAMPPSTTLPSSAQTHTQISNFSLSNISPAQVSSATKTSAKPGSVIGGLLRGMAFSWAVEIPIWILTDGGMALTHNADTAVQIMATIYTWVLGVLGGIQGYRNEKLLKNKIGKVIKIMTIVLVLGCIVAMFDDDLNSEVDVSSNAQAILESINQEEEMDEVLDSYSNLENSPEYPSLNITHIGYVTGDGVNVRSVPNTENSKILGKLDHNSMIEIKEINGENGWLSILYNGNEAYISEKYVNILCEVDNVTYTTVLIANDNIKAFQEPLVTAEIAATLNSGDNVQIILQQDEWYAVLYNKTIVFILEHDLGISVDLPLSTSELQGSGMVNDPFRINSYLQLENIVEDVGSGNDYSGQYFLLENSIELKRDWIPIGSENHPFNGHFDGNGCAITNLYIEENNMDYCGFFGVVGREGSISNLIVSGSVKNNASYIGGLAGKNYGLIENCINNVAINVNSVAGGIAGENMQGSIIHCSNNAIINGKGDAIGGVVGKSCNGEVSNCTNFGNVESKGGYIGGIVGHNYKDYYFPDTEAAIVHSCKNEAEIIRGYECIGGIVGWNNSSHIKECTNKANIIGDSYVGGVVGVVYWPDSVVSNCENHGTVKATTENADVIVGYIQEAPLTIIENCSNYGILEIA